MLSNEVGEQHPFPGAAAVVEPLRLSLRAASSGERLPPVRSALATARRRNDHPATPGVGEPGEDAGAGVGELMALARHPGPGRAPGRCLAGLGHLHRPAKPPARSSSVQRPALRAWFGLAVDQPKRVIPFFKIGRGRTVAWLSHVSGGPRRTSTNRILTTMLSDLRLCSSLAFAGVR